MAVYLASALATAIFLTTLLFLAISAARQHRHEKLRKQLSNVPHPWELLPEPEEVSVLLPEPAPTRATRMPPRSVHTSGGGPRGRA